jgi:NADP-dependent 3-hydroxy acid dehydrogenase YdfG
LALGKAPAHQNDIGDIVTMLDTNCKALAVLTRSVARGMVKRDWVRAS